MAFGDDVKNNAQDLKGHAKEEIGKATGDDKLRAEGKADQAGAQVKQVVSDVKDKLFGDDKDDAKS
jgi:uncharacterized protein YjbJ (UPF0337 family)